MVRTQIQMTKEQVEKLKHLASIEHRSMAELIRQAVDSFVASRTEIDIDERRKHAITAAGRFHSKVSDLSIAHDRFLAEAYSE